jgi:oligopeptide transport system substrate-binding protein
MRRRGRWARWFGTVAAVGLLAGCGGGSGGSDAGPATPETQDAPQPGGTLRVGIVEPDGIDPAFVIETGGAQITRLLFEPLVRDDDNRQIVPAAASSWEIDDARTTYTFHLRDDLRFSTGQPVTAEDFAFELRREADPDTASPVADPNLPIVGMAEAVGSDPDGIIGNVSLPGVRATDPRTLQIKTTEPYALLLSDMTSVVPVPADAVDTEEKARQFAERPIGNGPYQMAAPWDHNTAIDLERNPEFSGTPGLPDRIENVIFADETTSYREAQAGNLDISSVPVSQRGTARDAFPDGYLEAATGAAIYIFLPLDQPPFDDLDLRRAISLAIDRDALAERVLEGTAIPATNIAPDSAQGAKPDACPDCRFDPEEARRLFESSSGASATQFTAYFPAGVDLDEAAKTVGNDIRAALGVDVVFQSVELGQFIQSTEEFDGPYGFGWQPSTPSAYDYLAPLFETGSPNNDDGYSNSEFDQLMVQARRSASSAELDAALGDAQDIIGRDMPVVPLVFPNLINVHTARVRNVSMDPYGYLQLEQVEVVS